MIEDLYNSFSDGGGCQCETRRSIMQDTTEKTSLQRQLITRPAGAWNFDPHSHSTAELIQKATAILEKNGVHTVLCLHGTQKLHEFCTKVALSYSSDLPYHNFSHGFMVMHITNELVQISTNSTTMTSAVEPVSPLMKSTLLIAALCHDIFHDGRTNSFHVKSKSKTALTYSTTSTLERMHAAKTLETLASTKLLCNMKERDAADVRKRVCEMILSTDMSLQKNLLESASRCRTDTISAIDFSKVVIHCADISNPTLKPSLSQKWASLVLEEFTQQLDDEKARGMEQTLFLKASKGSVEEASLHLGFIKTFVHPAWKTLSSLLPQNALDYQLEMIDTNISFWEKEKI